MAKRKNFVFILGDGPEDAGTGGKDIFSVFRQ
jgi:hypothetical protein